MGKQVSGDARQPVGSKGVQTRLLDGVEQTGGVRILWPMLLMDRSVVKAPLEDDAIGEGAKATVRRCVGLRYERVSIFDAGERPSAGGNSTNALTVVHGSRSRPIERW